MKSIGLLVSFCHFLDGIELESCIPSISTGAAWVICRLRDTRMNYVFFVLFFLFSFYREFLVLAERS